MNAPLRKPMSYNEFLAWERRQELRYEFDGFAPVAMTGGSFEHAIIQRNLITALTNRLRGKPCQAIGIELKIAVAGSIRYPDAFVVCSPVPRGTQLIEAPVVVFEILSHSTAVTDRVVKNREYRDTPSIIRYVMLEQFRPAATMFERAGEDWVGHVIESPAVLMMPEISIELPLPEIFEGVEFPETLADD
ncbi:MAG TPA: Uma2 family endonuclease [Acetobacteraceae bacterium]|nr:Uma2 family endonuclease [Acetobacteraceae bacterium]